MERLKKSTLVLVLASVITVAGSYIKYNNDNPVIFNFRKSNITAGVPKFVQMQDFYIKNFATYTDSYSAEENTVKDVQQDEGDENSGFVESDESNTITDSDFVPLGVQQETQNNSVDKVYSVLLTLLIIFVSIFIFLRTKQKMSDITGDSINLDDEEKPSLKNLKKTVSKLDKKYARTSIQPKKVTISPIDLAPKPSPVQRSVEEEDSVNIVDLDELYKNQTSSSSKSGNLDELEAMANSALDDFLNDFDFEDSVEENVEIELGFDTELYDKILNKNSLRFSDEDVAKITSLTNVELSEVIIKQRREYLATEPIKPAAPKQPRDKAVEELITNYATSEHIIFKEEDIKTLNELANFEIDPEFVTDLTTDSERTKQMEYDILFSECKKPSEKEPEMLQVRDLLPDLQDAVLHPEKYLPQEETAKKVDPDDLLKALDNVQFKPFYEENSSENDSYVDFDELKPRMDNSEPDKKSVIEKNLGADFSVEAKPKSFNNIDQSTIDRQSSRMQLSNRRVVPNTAVQKNGALEADENLTCILDGEAFCVVDNVPFNNKQGCYLVKNSNGYEVLGYIGDKITKLRHFDNIISEKIHARMSEKITGNGRRYLVKVDSNKFIISVEENNIRFVMDL